MNRTLRRPMFRRGGSASSGITSGLDTPRQGYKEPGMVQQDDLQRAVFQTAEDMKNPDLLAAYKPYMERPKGEAMNRFLTSFGLDLMSRPSAGSGFGGLLSTAAQSAKGPTDQLFKDIDSRRLNKNAAEADLFKTLLQGKIDIMGEAAGNEGGAKEYRDLAIANELEMIIPEIYKIQNKIKEAKDTGQEVNENDIVRLEVLQTKRNNFTKSNPVSEGAIKIFTNSSEGQTIFSTITEKLMDDNPGMYKEGSNELYSAAIKKVKELLGLFSSGGRAEYQMGGGVDMAQQPMMMPQETMTMDQGTMDNGKNNLISYDQLRARLPNEITDDIVELMSNSAEALEDFAMISSQQDVTQFNKKYSVNLVLPSEA
jgi:hypothetical protein